MRRAAGAFDMALALAVAVALAGLAACAGRPQRATGVTADDAIFVVTTNVPAASVFVDGRFVGPAGMLRGGIAVAPGLHRVELRYQDHVSRYAELDLARGERRALELTMVPVPP